MGIIKLLQDKKIIVLSLIILMVVGVGIYFRLSNKPASKPAENINASKLVKTKVESKELVVEISKDGLVPQTVLIKKGGVVRFVNVDNNPHQIMSDPHPTHTLYSFLNTDEVLNKGESVTVILEEEGTFTYHDHLTPLTYKGVIKVE